MPGKIKNVIAAIDYIENHLHEKLDLDMIAEALHYSKYHLHRMFTGTVGLTIQTYAQRRRLTEAAKLLVFFDKPILEIAFTAGYESQQSFTDSFRAMYKKTPNQYREEDEFYPLQLRYVLNENPANQEAGHGHFHTGGKLSAVLSFLRTFGLILVFLLILPEFMGAAGVWLAVPIAELITMVVALSFLYQNKDKYHYA